MAAKRGRSGGGASGILANRYGWSILGLHSSGDVSNDLLLEAFVEAHQERSLAGRHFGNVNFSPKTPNQFSVSERIGP